jgi:hypothetical protein
MKSKVHTFKFMLSDIIVKIIIKFKSNGNFYCRHVTSENMHSEEIIMLNLSTCGCTCSRVYERERERERERDFYPTPLFRNLRNSKEIYRILFEAWIPL